MKRLAAGLHRTEMAARWSSSMDSQFPNSFKNQFVKSTRQKESVFYQSIDTRPNSRNQLPFLRKNQNTGGSDNPKPKFSGELSSWIIIQKNRACLDFDRPSKSPRARLAREWAVAPPATREAITTASESTNEAVRSRLFQPRLDPG